MAAQGGSDAATVMSACFLVAAFASTCAIGMLASGIRKRRAARYVQRNYLPVTARLGKVEQRDHTTTDEDGREHSHSGYWVRYRYEVDGRSFTGEDYLPNPGGMPTGTVYYDRNEPETSVGRMPRDGGDFSSIVMSLFLFAFALAFGGAALAVWHQQP